MKKLISFILIILLSLSLISCSKANDAYAENNFNDMKAETSSSGKYFGTIADGAMDYEAEMDMPMEAPEASLPEETKGDQDPLANRKIIYSSSYNLETKEFDKSIARLDTLVEELGGWYQSSNSYGTAESGNRNAYFTVRIPVEAYKNFISRQGEIGTVVSSSENNRDVTEQYTDTEARLESALLREERVLKILENAGSLDDVLALERELSDIRYEIENLTGSLRKYDSLVEFATVDISIREVTVYTPKTPVTLTFSERMSKGFSEGIDNFVKFVQNFLVFISYNLIALVFWAVVIIVVLVVIIKKTKGKKTKKNTENQETPDKK